MNTVNFMKQIIIALQKTYATLMMNIIRFYKQAKRYEKDNIKNNFSYSLLKKCLFKFFCFSFLVRYIMISSLLFENLL